MQILDPVEREIVRRTVAAVKREYERRTGREVIVRPDGTVEDLGIFPIIMAAASLAMKGVEMYRQRKAAQKAKKKMAAEEAAAAAAEKKAAEEEAKKKAEAAAAPKRGGAGGEEGEAGARGEAGAYRRIARGGGGKWYASPLFIIPAGLLATYVALKLVKKL